MKAISFLSVYLWLVLLRNTDSYYSVYLLIAVIGVVAIENSKKLSSRIELCRKLVISRDERCYILFTSVISICVVLANYKLFGGFLGIIKALVCLVSSLVIFGNIIKFVDESMMHPKFESHSSNNIMKLAIVVLSFSYGFYFITCGFPGNLDTDSFSSLRQILSGEYSNHHPICYTLLVEFWLSVSNIFLSDINVGIGLFNIFQIVCTVFVYSQIIDTIERLATKQLALMSMIWFAAMPVYIASSITMWKDIMFGLMVSLYCCSCARLFRNVGNKRFNYLLLFISGVGFGVFRHDGQIALGAAIIIFVIELRKCHARILVISILAFFLLHFLLLSHLCQLKVKQQV